MVDTIVALASVTVTVAVVVVAAVVVVEDGVEMVLDSPVELILVSSAFLAPGILGQSPSHFGNTVEVTAVVEVAPVVETVVVVVNTVILVEASVVVVVAAVVIVATVAVVVDVPVWVPDASSCSENLPSLLSPSSLGLLVVTT